MPYKVWTPGEEVLGTDFNDYVQEQVIATFANTSARNSGLTAPNEGQFAYLVAENLLTMWNGTAWETKMSPPIWTNFTPAISAQGGTPAVGNGTIHGRYRLDGKTVHAIATLLLGSTTNMGTGAFFMTLPLPISTAAALDEFALGVGHAAQAGTGRWPCTVEQTNATTVFWSVYNASGIPVEGAAIPFAWTTGDKISYNVCYETD